MLKVLLTAGAVALALLPAPASAAEAPREVLTVLPPGNSGHFSVGGQAQGMAGGSYGDHVDDQRDMYWKGQYKPGRFTTPGPDAEQPRPGVRVGRDPYGVPVVAGDTAEDVWWGAGWAAGQDRLFLADAVRRYARGTYAELVGPSGLEIDRQARAGTYSVEEYGRMLARLPVASQRVIRAYADGLNAWITKVRSDPRLLPAEYVLLTTLPEPWTVTDTLAAGVLITRTVASAGGDEFQLVEVLRRLQEAMGKETGRRAFLDLHWQDDRKASTTVPASEGVFDDGRSLPAAQERKRFDAAADWALSLPPELGEGLSAGVPAIPGTPTADPDGFPLGDEAGPTTTAADVALSPARRLVQWARSLHGGSYQVAVAPSRSATGGALLESAPQLGYSYPATLWELEVHGGGYDARGVSVPGLPTVGIGYGERTAWALTTGNTKTIDSFVEQVRRVGGRLQYLHKGVWRSALCRVEEIRHRQEVEGVPVGAAVQTVDYEVCRTAHGPVVAYSRDGRLARSLQIGMWGRELETVNGILAWNRVDDLRSFDAAVGQVTWNENVMYADADGRIAYWHPGLVPTRPRSVDTRFPARGDGSQDWTGFFPRSRLPHVVDPAQGWLANWNNKPAVGWTDTWLTDPAAMRPSAKATRYQALADLLAADRSVSMADLQRIDWRAGTLDYRARDLRPLLVRLLGTRGLTPEQRAARDLLARWDGTAYGPRAGTSPGELTDESVTDGPAPTLFRAMAQAVPTELLRDVPVDVLRRSDRYAGHVFDLTQVDKLVLRVLDPSSSSLRPQHDHLRGRTREAVVRAALDRAIAQLTDRYGADPASWRARHPRSAVSSLTGVIGPSLTMPYQDRGSWIHLVAFRGAARPAARRPVVPAAAADGLPATGPPGALPALAAGLLMGAAVLRRRRCA